MNKLMMKLMMCSALLIPVGVFAGSSTVGTSDVSGGDEVVTDMQTFKDAAANSQIDFVLAGHAAQISHVDSSIYTVSIDHVDGGIMWMSENHDRSSGLIGCELFSEYFNLDNENSFKNVNPNAFVNISDQRVMAVVTTFNCADNKAVFNIKPLMSLDEFKVKLDQIYDTGSVYIDWIGGL